MPNLPPWLIPSDPAPAALRGFTVGAQIGQHRAEQRFREAQMARQEQLAAMDQARWEAEIGMKAAESARRHDAQMQYRQAIEGGMDPLDAMIRFGPEMGQQGSAEAAAIRAMYQKEKPVQTWEERTLPGGGRVMMGSQGGILNLPAEPKPEKRWITETRIDRQTGQPFDVLVQEGTENEKLAPRLGSNTSSLEVYADKNELERMEQNLREVNKALREPDFNLLYKYALGKPEEKRKALDKQYIEDHAEYERQRERLMRDIAAMETKFRGQTTGTMTAPTGGIRVLSIRPKG